jgi:hypothetical protein
LNELQIVQTLKPHKHYSEGFNHSHVGRVTWVIVFSEEAGSDDEIYYDNYQINKTPKSFQAISSKMHRLSYEKE